MFGKNRSLGGTAMIELEGRMPHGRTDQVPGNWPRSSVVFYGPGGAAASSRDDGNKHIAAQYAQSKHGESQPYADCWAERACSLLFRAALGEGAAQSSNVASLIFSDG